MARRCLRESLLTTLWRDWFEQGGGRRGAGTRLRDATDDTPRTFEKTELFCDYSGQFLMYCLRSWFDEGGVRRGAGTRLRDATDDTPQTFEIFPSLLKTIPASS